MGALTIEGLWQAYRTKTSRGGRERGGVAQWALRDLDLEAGPGDVVGLIGANGSGKTTLLRSIAGVLEPTRGKVRISGPVAALVDLTAGIARDLTGRENLLLTGVLLGMSRAEVRKRYDEIVEFAELSTEVLRSPIYTYSEGMVLRLGAALLVACRPEVLCVDEVLAVGDEAFQHKCLHAIEQLRERGACVVLASHDLDLIRERGTKVCLLDRGRVVFTGSPAEAVDHYLRISTDAAT